MARKLTVGNRTTFKALCVDEDGVAIDLTNGVLTLRYWLNGGPAKEITGTITDEEGGVGTAKMPVANATTMVGLYEPGELEYEWHLLDNATAEDWTSEDTYRRAVRARVPAPA